MTSPLATLLSWLLGSTPGARTSEGRLALGGFLTGLGLILTGDTPDGVLLILGAVLGHSGARAIPKAAEILALARAKAADPARYGPVSAGSPGGRDPAGEPPAP